MKAVVALFFQPVILQMPLASYSQDLVVNWPNPGPGVAQAVPFLHSSRNLGKTDRGIQRCGHSRRKHVSAAAGVDFHIGLQRMRSFDTHLM